MPPREPVFVSAIAAGANTDAAVVAVASGAFAAPAEWLSPDELRELRGRRRGVAGRAAARAAGKAALLAALARVGAPDDVLPSPTEIRLGHDGHGRPGVTLPERAARWLEAAGLGVDLSMSHERANAVAAVTIGPSR